LKFNYASDGDDEGEDCEGMGLRRWKLRKIIIRLRENKAKKPKWKGNCELKWGGGSQLKSNSKYK